MSDAYDPNLPEGEKPRGSQYISKRDMRVLAIAFVVLAILLIPVYQWGVRNAHKASCIRNMSAIAKAIEFYALDKDDRLPVAYYTQDWDSTAVSNSGFPRVWASDIAMYMNTRADFVCPAAGPDEVVTVEGNGAWRNGEPIRLTYGMYTAMSAALRSTIERPESVIILAETANKGANRTFDPRPITPADGFVIGWDDSNFMPTPETQKVTRLAFPGTQDGDFVENGPGRHDIGIHAISGMGARINLKPQQARVTISRSTGLPEGLWAVPPGARRRG